MASLGIPTAIVGRLPLAAAWLERLRSHFDRHTPYHVYHFLSQVPPALTIGVVAGAGLLVLSLRRWGKQMTMLGVLAFCLSFVAFSSGREVIAQAVKLPLGDRPYCVFKAVVQGAVWQSGKLKDVKACRVTSTHVQKAKAQVDSGADGRLTAPLVSGSWSATVVATAPSAHWDARSVDTAGSRDVYLETTGVAYKLSACPSLSNRPPAWAADGTGHAQVDALYKVVDPSLFAQFPDIGARSKGLARTATAHVYRFYAAGDRTTGYLLPAAGDQGDCALLSGPYARRGAGYVRVAHPSGSELDRLSRLAATTTVSGLKSSG